MHVYLYACVHHAKIIFSKANFFPFFCFHHAEAAADLKLGKFFTVCNTVEVFENEILRLVLCNTHRTHALVRLSECTVFFPYVLVFGWFDMYVFILFFPITSLPAPMYNMVNEENVRPECIVNGTMNVTEVYNTPPAAAARYTYLLWPRG